LRHIHIQYIQPFGQTQNREKKGIITISSRDVTKGNIFMRPQNQAWKKVMVHFLKINSDNAFEMITKNLPLV
jgi:hypothetical protein